MKYFAFILASVLFFISCKEVSQSAKNVDLKLASVHLKQTFDKKNKWLIENQLDSLATLVHPQVVYGHSNCWVQSAADLINTTPADSLSYLSIEMDGLEINPIGNTGIISGVGHFVGIYKRDTFDMHLCFVETYSFDDNKWQLVGRQAAKVPKD